MACYTLDTFERVGEEKGEELSVAEEIEMTGALYGEKLYYIFQELQGGCNHMIHSGYLLKSIYLLHLIVRSFLKDNLEWIIGNDPRDIRRSCLNFTRQWSIDHPRIRIMIFYFLTTFPKTINRLRCIFVLNHPLVDLRPTERSRKIYQQLQQEIAERQHGKRKNDENCH